MTPSPIPQTPNPKIMTIKCSAGEEMQRRGPDTCDYTFHTTAGSVTFRAWRALSPHGADRLHNLARLGYYDGSPLYRVLPGFVAQFGVATEPSVSAVYDWRNDVPGAIIPDEAPTLRESSGGGGGVDGDGEGAADGGGSNGKHWLAYSASYGAAGFATNRTAELFVSLVDNTERLDGKGFAAFAKVMDGAGTLDRWYAGYGEMDGACQLHKEGGWVCDGPKEERLYAQGGAYIDTAFPRMDRIAWVEVEAAAGAGGGALWDGEGAPGAGAGVVWWLLMVLTVGVGLAMWARRCVVSEKVRSRVLNAFGGAWAGTRRGTPLFGDGEEATGTAATAAVAGAGAAPAARDVGSEASSSLASQAAVVLSAGFELGKATDMETTPAG